MPNEDTVPLRVSFRFASRRCYSKGMKITCPHCGKEIDLPDNQAVKHLRAIKVFGILATFACAVAFLLTELRLRHRVHHTSYLTAIRWLSLLGLAFGVKIYVVTQMIDWWNRRSSQRF